MASAEREPRNLFFDLLIPASVIFVVTVLAYSLVPWHTLPAWFQEHGWKALLVEVAVIIVLGLASMVLDRMRSLRKARESSTMGPAKQP